MSDLDRELSEALAAFRDEALPESALASVRAGVRSRIEGERRRRVWTAWLSLATATAAVWLAVFIPWSVATLPLQTPRTPEVVSIALARPFLPGQEARLKPGRSLKSAPQGGTPVRLAALWRVRSRRNVLPPEPVQLEQTQFMRIITDDPNVVILWAMNSKGETR